jgi:hypothetical protein
VADQLPPPPREAVVDHVVDPDGAVWIVRVSGPATHRTVDEIDRITGTAPPRSTVHLDLFDASIPSGPVMQELARLADRLEYALVRVRMVGLDPHHPAIDPQR